MSETTTDPAEILRRAAEQARAEAATELSIAPAIERMYGGDDSGTRLTARRHAAVADLLGNEAALIDGAAERPDLHMPVNGARVDLLLSVARTYLGESA